MVPVKNVSLLCWNILSKTLSSLRLLSHFGEGTRPGLESCTKIPFLMGRNVQSCPPFTSNTVFCFFLLEHDAPLLPPTGSFYVVNVKEHKKKASARAGHGLTGKKIYKDVSSVTRFSSELCRIPLFGMHCTVILQAFSFAERWGFPGWM